MASEHVAIRIFTYFFILATAILYILALVGCISSSPFIPDLGIVNIELLEPNSNATSATLDNSTASVSVSVGYYGICVHHPALPENPSCANTEKGDAQTVTEAFASKALPANFFDSATPAEGDQPQEGTTTTTSTAAVAAAAAAVDVSKTLGKIGFDVARMSAGIALGLDLQRRFFCYFLAGPAICFGLGFLIFSVAMVGRSRFSTDRFRLVRFLVLGPLGLSVLLSAAASLVITQVARALRLGAGVAVPEGETAQYGFVQGNPSMGLHWSITATSACVFFLALFLISGEMKRAKAAEAEGEAAYMPSAGGHNMSVYTEAITGPVPAPGKNVFTARKKKNVFPAKKNKNPFTAKKNKNLFTIPRKPLPVRTRA